MRSVIIEVSSLLAKVEQNRRNHSIKVKEAKSARRKRIKAYLTNELHKLDNDQDYEIDQLELFPSIQDHSEEYDTIILMLKMSSSNTIELSHHEFQQYVMDNWDWKFVFNSTNAGYLGND